MTEGETCGDFWVSLVGVSVLTSNVSKRKGQPTFLFERVLGLLGGRQTPFGTSCNLRATSAKEGPPLMTYLGKPHLHSSVLSTSVYSAMWPTTKTHKLWGG